MNDTAQSCIFSHSQSNIILKIFLVLFNLILLIVHVVDDKKHGGKY